MHIFSCFQTNSGAPSCFWSHGLTGQIRTAWLPAPSPWSRCLHSQPLWTAFRAAFTQSLESVNHDQGVLHRVAGNLYSSIFLYPLTSPGIYFMHLKLRSCQAGLGLHHMSITFVAKKRLKWNWSVYFLTAPVVLMKVQIPLGPTAWSPHDLASVSAATPVPLTQHVAALPYPLLPQDLNAPMFPLAWNILAFSLPSGLCWHA